METRTARSLGSVLFGLAAILLLFSAYVALVYHGDVDEGAKWVVDSFTFEEWIIGFLIGLGVLFLLILVVLAIPVSRAAQANQLQVNCANCSRVYAVADSGERPLYHTCPHCGYTDQTGGNPEMTTPPNAEPIPEPTPGAAVAAEADQSWQPQVVEREEGGERKKYLVLKCGNCFTNFEVNYSTDRPLYTTCSNCGRKGVLRTPVEAGG